MWMQISLIDLNYAASGSLKSMDQEQSMNNLVTVWNIEHTSLFVLPYKHLCFLTQAVSITDWGLFQEALKTLKGNTDLRAPRSPNTLLAQENLSVALPGNNICLSYAVLTARQKEHTLDNRSATLKRGLGATEPQLNHFSVWGAQKSKWECRSESETARAQWGTRV